MRTNYFKLMSIVINVLVVILGISAVTRAFDIADDKILIFRFFTNDGNIFNIIVSIISIIYLSIHFNKKEETPSWLFILNLLATSSEILILLVVLFVLMPQGGLVVFRGYHLIVLHALNPILTLIGFIFFNSQKISLWKTILSVIPVLVYGIPVLLLCILKVIPTEIAPYSFFKVYVNPWYETLLYMVGLVLGTSLISLGVYKLQEIIKLDKISNKVLIILFSIVLILLLSFIIFLVIIQ